MKIGYARVSTTDQHLDLQIQALRAAGCDEIYEDRMTGARVKNRPGLQDALSKLNSADTLMVWKLDRLARSVKGLVDLIAEGLDADVGMPLHHPAPI